MNRYSLGDGSDSTSSDVDGSQGWYFAGLHYLLWGKGKGEFSNMCSSQTITVPIHDWNGDIAFQDPPNLSSESSKDAMFEHFDIRSSPQFHTLPEILRADARLLLPCFRPYFMVLKDYVSLYHDIKKDDRAQRKEGIEYGNKRYHALISGQPGIGN